MSCTTLYALRASAGWTFAVEKYGRVDLASRDAVRRLILHSVSEFDRGLEAWLDREGGVRLVPH